MRLLVKKNVLIQQKGFMYVNSLTLIPIVKDIDFDKALWNKNESDICRCLSVVIL